MVVAAVLDLMLASRIRAAAATASDIRFAKTAAEILELARSLHPHLVLIDLNAGALDPIGTVAALKADQELRSIRTVGFVSHVQGDLVAAARGAGIDEVLARSAFVSRLPDLVRP